MSLRDAAQQALEALEEYQAKGAPFWACDAAVAALRAALAEPQPQPQPVAWLVTTEMQDGTRRTYPMTGRLKDAKDACDFGDPAPLYTTPPQRQPLTEEEIARLWSWSMTAEAERTANTQQHAFARALEKAHNIGGDK